eukprot:7259683-Prymnesium_polylepis.1
MGACARSGRPHDGRAHGNAHDRGASMMGARTAMRLDARAGGALLRLGHDQPREAHRAREGRDGDVPPARGPRAQAGERAGKRRRKRLGGSAWLPRRRVCGGAGC